MNKLVSLLASYIALKIYKKRGNTVAIYRNLKRLNTLYHKKASYHYELSNFASKQNMWKESLDHLNTAIEKSDNSVEPEFYLKKAEIFVNLNKPLQAITYYKNYLQIKPQNQDAIYKLGNLYYKRKKWDSAVLTFESLLLIKPADASVSFKLAESYYNLYSYEKAKEYYTQTIKYSNNKLNRQHLSIAYYKLGFIELKNSNDSKSKELFQKAINLDTKFKSKTLGIGAFHEHYNQLELAIQAYKNKLSKNMKGTNLYFKIASLYKNLHNFKQSIVYLNKLLAVDKTEAEWHYELAHCYEVMEDFDNASIWYRSAIARELNHNPSTYHRLAFVLEKKREYMKAIQTYKNANLFERPNNIKPSFYKRNISEYNVRYGISYQFYSVNKKTIFYESMSGGRMMGSPYAIFQNIINDIKFHDFIHVWVVNSFRVIPTDYRTKDNVIFVKRDTDAYFKYISKAGYIICDSTLARYVVRKPNQKYLQTSHGIFYKTVGRDSINTPIGVPGATRNLLQATHIIVPNEYMAEKQPKSYSIEHIYSGNIAKVGYPRIDVTINLSAESKRKIIQKLGINPSKQIVFYAPTWRGGSKADNKFDSKQLVHDLKEMSTLDVNIVFRGHPITNRLLKNVKLPDNIIVPKPSIQTNELLGISDILISDYSSVFFDFIVTERPIIHYLYDKKDYLKERGLNLEDYELPGCVVETCSQLIDTINNKLSNNKPSKRYLRAKRRFSPYDDGKSTERVINWLFLNEKDDIKIIKKQKDKQSILYLGGFLNEVNIQNLINDLNKLAETNNTVSLVLNNQVKKSKAKLKYLSQLNENVNFIVHDKSMPITIEEAYALNYFDRNNNFLNNQMVSLYKTFFERQSRRLFGDTCFDEVINCVSSSNYWESLKNAILERNKIN